MSKFAIEAAGLGKAYSLRRASHKRSGDTFRDAISQTAIGTYRKLKDALHSERMAENPTTEEFWALKDVSFHVEHGETVGIIGRNGAGKSTLLKILSRIVDPTQGSAVIRGRIASLLEVGTGFHPELSGRENIFLNGAIMGMNRGEIRRKFDAIVEFAGVEKFLDTPVKRYSSGMYVRLAFAVAAHLDPDILIVDEVLAVGDLEFQKKCLGKMDEVSRDGRTVLFVSHNMDAMSALCSRAIRLSAGKIIGIGEAAEQIKLYLNDSSSDNNSNLPYSISSNLTLDRLSFSPSTILSLDPVEITLVISAKEAEILGEVAMLIYSQNGTRAALIDLRNGDGAYKLLQDSSLEIKIKVDSFSLVPGRYDVGFFFQAQGFHGDALNIVQIDVMQASRELAPYPAIYRGYAELNSRFAFEICPR